jgi:hypothetical protein
MQGSEADLRARCCDFVFFLLPCFITDPTRPFTRRVLSRCKFPDECQSASHESSRRVRRPLLINAVAKRKTQLLPRILPPCAEAVSSWKIATTFRFCPTQSCLERRIKCMTDLPQPPYGNHPISPPFLPCCRPFLPRFKTLTFK